VSELVRPKITDCFTVVKDSPLLGIQQEVKEVTDEMLRFRSAGGGWEFRLREVNPRVYFDRLRQSSLGGLILPGEINNSAIVSANPEIYADYPNPEQLNGISLRVWGDSPPMYRQVADSDGRKMPKAVLIRRERDWQRMLRIVLKYEPGTLQYLTMSTDSMSAGEMPTYLRTVYDPRFDDTGYPFPVDASRDFLSEGEAHEFLGIAKELYETWKAENPERTARVLKPRKADSSKTS
jgi:hypothetical protein